MNIKTILAAGAIGMIVLLSTSCGSDAASEAQSHQPEVTRSGLKADNFKTEIDGKETGLFTLVNADSMEVCITNYGGRIVSVLVPGHDGQMHNVALGFDSISAYDKAVELGFDTDGVKGRYAGMIKDRETGDDVKQSYGNKVFDAELTSDTTLTLTLMSEEKDSRMPGKALVRVDYTLRSDNTLDVDFTATADTTTLMDLSQKLWLNLSGDFGKSVSEHRMKLSCEQYLPMDSLGTPTGHSLMGIWTPMGFNDLRKLGLLINSDFEQIKWRKGLDAFWVLPAGTGKRHAARLEDPSTGVAVDIFATSPVVRVTTAKFPEGMPALTGEITPSHNGAISFTPQARPVVKQMPQRTSTSIGKNEPYSASVSYRFSVIEKQ